MLPPAAASGEICPILNPEVPPLNLPSVIKAHSLPKCLLFIYDVGYNISCIPGPPFGPSCVMTTTSPLTTLPPKIPSQAASCESKTLAGPANFQILSSTPAVFTTQPSCAMFPFNTAKPPSFE